MTRFAIWMLLLTSQLIAAEKPNVILIMTDDQGFGDVRSHGNKKIDTPTLDRLASQGARLDRFFVCPVCAPTRASLLTGRYHFRTGVSWVTRGLETMRSEETTLAEVFKANQYHTGCFGKWHNGAHYPEHPNGQGFDEFVGFCAGHWNNYFDTGLERNGKEIKMKGYITDVLTDEALGFIREHQKKSFFCYVPYNAPHSPWQVPDRYFQKYKKRGLDDKTACAYGMVENIDDNINRILKTLDQLKLTDNTIVIFLTDNGPNSNRYNAGMKGRKGSVHEGGVRVPCFIRWPGQIRAGTTISQISAHIDLLPTLVSLCDLKKPKTLPLDGISVASLLLGKTTKLPDRYIFTPRSRAGKPGSVRSQQYRLVLMPKRVELYDMAKDPGQQKNIAKKHPQIAKRMKSAFETWYRDAIKGFRGRPVIQIGHEQRPSVTLPAHEAYLKGSVKYKGRMGWANDWITNWVGTDDQVWWELEVVKSGKYEIEIHYTTSKENVGSEVQVSVGTSKVKATVEKAHNPKPIPSPDRVDRGEVYEKRWGKLYLGTVTLQKGRQKLTIQALTKAGKQVMDLKAVRLSRKSPK
mgnify:CR=1 FL=1